jgi:hypothetical protein
LPRLDRRVGRWLAGTDRADALLCGVSHRRIAAFTVSPFVE